MQDPGTQHELAGSRGRRVAERYRDRPLRQSTLETATPSRLRRSNRTVLGGSRSALRPPPPAYQAWTHMHTLNLVALTLASRIGCTRCAWTKSCSRQSTGRARTGPSESTPPAAGIGHERMEEGHRQWLARRISSQAPEPGVAGQCDSGSPARAGRIACCSSLTCCLGGLRGRSRTRSAERVQRASRPERAEGSAKMAAHRLS